MCTLVVRSLCYNYVKVVRALQADISAKELEQLREQPGAGGWRRGRRRPQGLLLRGAPPARIRLRLGEGHHTHQEARVAAPRGATEGEVSLTTTGTGDGGRGGMISHAIKLGIEVQYRGGGGGGRFASPSPPGQFMACSYRKGGWAL